MATEISHRPINKIAQEIYKEWANVHHSAKPYLEAMLTLRSLDDSCGNDAAPSIINYFLGNARTWRGDAAKKIKAELLSMIQHVR